MENEVSGHEITELRLGLPGERNGKKRAFLEISLSSEGENGNREEEAKTRIVGWPPICSYREKMKKKSDEEKNSEVGIAKCYVKVSMDGVPFLRKIDLNMYQGYSSLSIAFGQVFRCLRIGNIFNKDPEFSEYSPIYEDKDGDWMLVGDVPWEMFIESCRRLRIMKRPEATEIEHQV